MCLYIFIYIHIYKHISDNTHSLKKYKKANIYIWFEFLYFSIFQLTIKLIYVCDIWKKYKKAIYIYVYMIQNFILFQLTWKSIYEYLCIC